MNYNLKNYLRAFQDATAVHATRKVIICRASPQFCDPRFLLAAARELCPSGAIRLPQACEALASSGYVGTLSPADRTTTSVVRGGCACITPSAFEVLKLLISFDTSKIPPALVVESRRN